MPSFDDIPDDDDLIDFDDDFESDADDEYSLMPMPAIKEPKPTLSLKRDKPKGGLSLKRNR